MAWPGSTDTSSRDVRKRVAAHIASTTTHGMALVTDSRGELTSSSVAPTKLSTMSGSTSNIQAQLDALDAIAGSLDISQVHGL